jgi:membrane protein YdbS with pleckstrin-like domain
LQREPIWCEQWSRRNIEASAAMTRKIAKLALIWAAFWIAGLWYFDSDMWMATVVCAWFAAVTVLLMVAQYVWRRISHRSNRTG